MQLSTWDKEELDAQLANRVQVSKRAVAKVLQAFDRLQQRNDKIWRAIKGDGDGNVYLYINKIIKKQIMFVCLWIYNFWYYWTKFE